MSDDIYTTQLQEFIKNNTPTTKNIKRLENTNKKLYNHIINQFPERTNLSEKVYCILDENNGLCKCGNQRKLKRPKLGLNQYCGNKCDFFKRERTQKAQETMIKRYGAKCSFEAQKIKEKIDNTFIEKYGVKRPFELKEIQDKVKQNNIKKYGVDNPMKTKEIQEKLKEANIKKYNSPSPFGNGKIQDKIKQINVKKYGVKNYSQFHIPKELLTLLKSKEKFNEFMKNKTIQYGANLLNLNYYTILNYVNEYNTQYIKTRSSFELEMEEFLKENNISFIQNARQQISPYELDFYLPDYNLAIECNGDYWHSSKFKEKNYHYNKHKKCKEKNIHLIQINESDWNYNKEKFKELIKTNINKKERGDAARKCHIDKINGKTAKNFLNKYHLQGHVGATYHYGAFNNLFQLVGVMSFGWTRGNKKARRFELKRWAMDNKNHPGLFSKTFKFAQKDIGFEKVVSFSDNSWFSGNLYEKNGFIKGKELNPDYKYFYEGKLVYKSNFKRNNIYNKFKEDNILIEMYNNGKTEKEMMNYLDIPSVYDSGKQEWLWKIST